METKLHKTYAEQVDILREHGCLIADAANAEEYLSFVGYYRLSGYFLPFKRSDGKFKSGVTFERIAAIYDFDQRLRALLYRAIGNIEIFARTAVAYRHTGKYGELAYTDRAYFCERHEHEAFMSNFNKAVGNNDRALFVRHHIEKYNGEFPLWVAVELFTLGMLSHFYADLLPDDQKAVAAEFGTSYNYLFSWLQCLTVLRNSCAHYKRFYYGVFTQTPKLPKKYANFRGCALFGQLVMLKLLYRKNREMWNTVVEEMNALVDKYRAHLDFKHIGFPDDWETVLRW